MKIIIDSVNFEPDEELNIFIRQKSKSFVKIDYQVLLAEFNLSQKKQKYFCKIVLVVDGRNLVITKHANDMTAAVAIAIVGIERMLRKKRKKELEEGMRRMVELNSYTIDDESLFSFSAN